MDDARAYKPHPAPYRHALRRLDVPAEETMVVAAHAWDVNGAARAGLRTAWLAHAERELTSAAPEPDVTASGLAELAEMLASGRAGSARSQAG